MINMFQDSLSVPPSWVLNLEDGIDRLPKTTNQCCVTSKKINDLIYDVAET